MSEPRTRPTQAERRAASESALLRAAAELIADHGPEGATLRNIGKRAGASRAMPGYHFGSKDELIERLFREANEHTTEAIADAIEEDHRDPSTMSTLETLRLFAETYLRVIAGSNGPEERAVVVMWGASFPTRSPLESIRESDAENHTHLVQLVREGQRDGSIRTDVDAATAATMVMGLVRGVAGLAMSHPGAADLAAVRELCGAAIVTSLTPPT